MPITIEDRGQNNSLDIPEELRQQLNGRVEFRGSDSHVGLQGPATSLNLQIGIGVRCRVEIGPHCVLGQLVIHCEHDARAQIGAAVGFNGTVRLLLHEPGAITVGDFCLFAGDVDVTLSDMHGIFDEITGRRLNPAQDVALCDHVWVGARAMILKGVTIGAYSVIGAGAVVTRNVPPNCVSAGSPARVVRRGVTWRHDLNE